jgi:DNA polymerase III epsilon subunit-like protein
MEGYEIYVCDVETTNRNPLTGDIIEICLIRLSTDETKTWYIRAINEDAIDPGALKVNHHILEEITWKTSAGKAKYMDPKKALVEIENWLAQDMLLSDERVLAGHNIGNFDYPYIMNMFERNGVGENFPFGRRILDTMQLEFAMDYAAGKLADAYSLAALNKKYGIKNQDAHRAEADTIATKQLLVAQLKKLSDKLK